MERVCQLREAAEVKEALFFSSAMEIAQGDRARGGGDATATKRRNQTQLV